MLNGGSQLAQGADGASLSVSLSNDTNYDLRIYHNTCAAQVAIGYTLELKSPGN